jgi:hypothetical protein
MMTGMPFDVSVLILRNGIVGAVSEFMRRVWPARLQVLRPIPQMPH